MAFHIVVVDDDLALQEFYRLLLESEGYKVTILSPFAFSLNSVAAFQADLFILDLLIGSKQSGWFILQALLDNPPALPVILVTALPPTAFEATWENFIQKHSIPLILKPFDVDTLLTVIKSLLPISLPSLDDSSYNEPVS